MFILQQAGGLFSAFDPARSSAEEIFSSRQILATNGLIHAEMAGILRKDFLDLL